MWFSSQLPLQSLIELCRALHHNLDAGLNLVQVFRQQVERGTSPVRPVAGRLLARLDRGHSLEAALQDEQSVFPPLFIDLVVVGEQTGTLAEIFGELERYYRMQQTLRRQFRSQIALPVAQFFIALFVIAVMLYVLGMIADSRGTQAADPVGFGFRGRGGALLFLAVAFGLIGLVVGGYFLLRGSLRGKRVVHDLLLRVPVVGPCLQAFALGRFTLALRLTLETGMPITEALRLSLRATGNAAFVARTGIVLDTLRAGDDLALALARSKIFPIDFQNIVAVAEEGGRIPEVMRRQAEHYQEEAGRRLTALTRSAGFGVWLLYAVFMIFAIFRIASSYFSALGANS
jgi:type IV pilus assembly protein PilC